MRLRLVHLASAHRKADTEHTCAEYDGKKRTEGGREPRERHEDSENTEKDESACAGHTDSISRLDDDDKFAADGVGMCSEMRLHFAHTS